MSDETKWALVWAAWALFFAVAETAALRSDKPQAPLSHQARRVLGARHPRAARRRAGQVAFASSAVWLGLHIWKEVEA